MAATEPPEAAEGEEAPRRKRRTRRGTGRRRGAGAEEGSDAAAGEDAAAVVSSSSSDLAPPMLAEGAAVADGLGGEPLAAQATSDLAGESPEPTGSLAASERSPADGEEEVALAGVAESGEAEANEASPGEVFTGLPPAIEVPDPLVIKEEVRSAEVAGDARPSVDAHPAEAERAAPEGAAQVQSASDDASTLVSDEPGSVAPEAAAAASLAPEELPAGATVAASETLAPAGPATDPEPARASGNGSAATHVDESEDATARAEATASAEEGAVPPGADPAHAEPQPPRTGWWSRFVRS